jgi:hypothetical protein
LVANWADPVKRATSARRAATLLVGLLTLGFVGIVLAGPSARANPGSLNQTAPTHCTPPTNPYNTSTTVATCGTTTTVSPATVTLTVTYQSGHVKWQACVNRSAAGSSVQLYIGQQGSGSAQPVDSSTINGSGCTPQGNVALCLAQGSYTATAVDQPYGQASRSFEVQNSGCRNPTTLAGSAGQVGSGSASGNHSGSLAFTGADIALMAIGAAVLLAFGYTLVKLSNRRRHVA